MTKSAVIVDHSITELGLTEYKNTMEQVPSYDNEFTAMDILNEDKNLDDVVERMIGDVIKEPYYHGHVMLDELEEVLLRNGDFIVKSADKVPKTVPPDTIKPSMLISIVAKSSQGLQEFPVTFRDDKSDCRVRTAEFIPSFKRKSVLELLKDHIETRTPVGKNCFISQGIAMASFQLPKNSVNIVTKLGEGNFGTVFKGTLTIPSLNGIETINVAIKVTRMDQENKENMNEMLKEARLMRQFDHQNVVKFYGMVMDNGQAMIIMELISGGGLDAYLKAKPDCTLVDRIWFSYDVAVGLKYLHSRQVMHRDIAARNCLVDTKMRKMAKISDFGMSRRGDFFKCSVTERVPIRWNAPEVLYTQMFTKASDVWSYGMVMYEIFSGKTPFYQYDTKFIRTKLNDPHFRPIFDQTEPHMKIPSTLKQLADACWQKESDKRPTMPQLVEIFNKLMVRLKSGQPLESDRSRKSSSIRNRTSGSSKMSRNKSSRRNSTSNESDKTPISYNKTPVSRSCNSKTGKSIKASATKSVKKKSVRKSDSKKKKSRRSD